MHVAEILKNYPLLAKARERHAFFLLRISVPCDTRKFKYLNNGRTNTSHGTPCFFTPYIRPFDFNNPSPFLVVEGIPLAFRL